MDDREDAMKIIEEFEYDSEAEYRGYNMFENLLQRPVDEEADDEVLDKIREFCVSLREIESDKVKTRLAKIMKKLLTKLEIEAAAKACKRPRSK